MSNIIYDEFYTMNLTNNNYVLNESTKGAFSGNGKIAFYNSMHKIGTDEPVIAVGNLDFDQIGKYRNNVVPTFRMNDIRLFTPFENSNIQYVLQNQSLNMLAGKCSSTFHVLSNNEHLATVQSEIIPLRQFPYCILQKISITPQVNMAVLDVHHLIYSHSNITNTEYNNNVIFNEAIYSDKGLYMMNATGYNTSVKTTLACASCYLNTQNCLGFNVLSKKHGCHQQLRYSSVIQAEAFSFDILTVTMTNNDFPDPLEEVKRIIMNIAFRESEQDSLVEQLENDSSNEWYTLWNSDILLNPKENISEEDRARVLRIRRYIRYSLYSIFCCIRLGINAEVNPLNLSYVDTNGNLFFDSDIWLVPTLLLLSPPIARTLLEFRYKGLEQAVQLAASYGYKGSKYPYENDILGYKGVYWDVASPLHIFNNAVIAINAWNYYRLTLDLDWLSSKGYPILKNVADFIVSNLTPDYDMVNIIGLGGRTSTNHAFTMYVSKLALKYTIEAGNQLQYRSKTTWIDAYMNMQHPILEDDYKDIILYDSTYTNQDTLNILDPLLILLPYYNELYTNIYTQNMTNTNVRIMNYYEDTIAPTFQSNPINLILIACVHGLISQVNTEQIQNFYDKLDLIIDTCGQTDYWGNLSRHDGVDIAICSLFVFMFLSVCGGIYIKGGIDNSGTRYADFSIVSENQKNWPDTWRNIIFSGIGNEQDLKIITNQM